MNTTFFWNGNKHIKYTLLLEEPFLTADYMLQLWKRDESYFFRCKPNPGRKTIDLIGHFRGLENYNMYFINEDVIMVNFFNQRPLLFS